MFAEVIAFLICLRNTSLNGAIPCYLTLNGGVFLSTIGETVGYEFLSSGGLERVVYHNKNLKYYSFYLFFSLLMQ